jgi:hypothetical protein
MTDKKEKFNIGWGDRRVGVIGKDGEMIGNFVVFDPKTRMLKSVDEKGEVVNLIMDADCRTWIPEEIEKKETEEDIGIENRSDILDI